MTDKLTADDLDDLSMQCEDWPEVTVGAHILLSLIAAALAFNSNDRNPDRAAAVNRALERGHRLCVKATSTDEPVTMAERRSISDFRIGDRSEGE